MPKGTPNPISYEDANLRKGHAVMILIHNHRVMYHSYVVTLPIAGSIVFFRHHKFILKEVVDHNVNGALVRQLYLETIKIEKV